MTDRSAAPARPAVVPADEWQRRRDELLVAEKEATRALDALAARRRRLPMTRFDASHRFETPDGPRTLLELFAGRDQLVVYQFMDIGPDAFCPGCTHFTNNVADVATLQDTGVTFVSVSNMPLEQFAAYRARMGWTGSFASSRDNGFAAATGAGDLFRLSVFLRDGDDVYLTWSTTGRGVDRLLFSNNVLDLTPYGRQEDWEDSPAGWPQHPTYG